MIPVNQSVSGRMQWISCSHGTLSQCTSTRQGSAKELLIMITGMGQARGSRSAVAMVDQSASDGVEQGGRSVIISWAMSGRTEPPCHQYSIDTCQTALVLIMQGMLPIYMHRLSLQLKCTQCSTRMAVQPQASLLLS